MMVGLFGGCGPKPLAPPPNPAASASPGIAQLISRGSYEDLQTAFERTKSTDRESAYLIALLLVARSKELGIRHAVWLEAADRLMPEGWQRYSDIVRSLPIDPLSDDREAVLKETAQSARPRELIEMWRDDLQSDPRLHPVVRSYLSLSLACGPRMFDRSEAAAKKTMEDHPSVPLLVYRSGICAIPEVLTTLTEFPDAALELGRLALAQADEEAALNHFQRAWTAFPSSPTIAFSIASIYERREEWSNALEYFDATLSLAGTHRDALLGRTVALSQLRQHDSAIASATTLIELQGWYLAEAHYWRSWNHYQTGSLPNARVEIDRSKQLSASAATLVLSAIVAWREAKLDQADRELSSALQQDFGYCEAAQYLGEVRAEDRRWDESLAALAHAEQCWGLSIDTNRKAIAQLISTDALARSSARRIAVHERAVADAERSRAAVVERAAAVRRQAASKSN